MAVARDWGQEGEEKGEEAEEEEEEEEASSQLHLILYASSSPCCWSIAADLEFIAAELDSLPLNAAYAPPPSSWRRHKKTQEANV